MAFAASNLTAEPRALSIGPVKLQLMTFTAVSGDTSGTITASAIIDRIDQIIIDGGLKLTAAPTFSGNVATIAFADPAANAFGNIIVIGV
jgi:hypothetical protein